ncbi:MAG: hypothetical protein JJV94_02875 [Sulfurospirillum sp.]|nr:hypothetical protein [Sulfurospirillum sp.]
MALAKLFQKYFLNIFISIIKYGNEWTVYSKIIKNGVLIDKFVKSFDVNESETIDKEMQEYLNILQSKYNFSYTILLLDSMGQGALSGTRAVDFKKNGIDMRSLTHLKIEKKWSIYTSFIDINWSKKLFSNVGLDFIYSPFIIQHSLLKKQKTEHKPILYMLNHETSVTITIFNRNNFLFGAYFKTIIEETISSVDDEDWENATEEDAINITELDNMDEEIGNIDELDGEGLGAFEDVILNNSSLELFGRDILIYKHLTSSLREFYKNPLYKGAFIDTVIVYDGYKTSSELIEMIENELFMDLKVHKINISEEICNIAIKEVLA